VGGVAGIEAMESTAVVEDDGLEVLEQSFSLEQAMSLIAKTARWVDQATFQLFPIWYPELYRRCLLYKSDWSEPQTNTNRKTRVTIHKMEGNVGANKALTQALDTTSKNRRNWSCCHIWGNDDLRFQQANFVVGDRRYFSCVANMVLLPTPLKAFTDSHPSVKEMIRICAFHYYGWYCNHDDLAEWSYLRQGEASWDCYPSMWPTSRNERIPPGVVRLNSSIRRRAEKRRVQIVRDLEQAGPFYPREAVQECLDYWKVDISKSIA
jgi:hypothetical protein